MGLKNQKNFRQYTGFLTPLFLLLTVIVFSIAPGFSSAAGISAKAAIVIDSESGEVLYAKNPDVKLPPASTTKLVTAMVSLDRLDPDDMVKISKKAAGTPSVLPKLKEGEKLSVRDLLSFALIRSINGAAVALAEAAAGDERSFVPLMNEKTRSIHAVTTKFINASGLPGRGQYTTARDLANIMKKALSYKAIADIIDKRVKEVDVQGKSVLLTNTNNLLWSDDDHLGGKTGYTRAARHCFVGASEKEEGVIVIALLGDSSRDKLWTDAEKLLAQDFEKGTIIITDQSSYKVKKRPVSRSRTKRSRTRSL